MEFQSDPKREASYLTRSAENLLEQRGTTKWVTQGDAGRKFYHANATIRHRRNTISSLITDDGDTISSHFGKEELI